MRLRGNIVTPLAKRVNANVSLAAGSLGLRRGNTIAIKGRTKMKEEIFNSLTPEEKKQLAILGNMLAQPISDEDAEQQRIMDAWADARGQEESK
jgi:hypothetical protein